MIFVDTGALLARYLPEDQYHLQAVDGWKRVQAERIPFATSTLVISETLTLLGRFSGYRFAAETGRLLYALPPACLIRPEREEERLAVEWLEKYADQQASFCDCVSFAIMRKRGLKDVFGFDRHFQSAGFSLWPEPAR